MRSGRRASPGRHPPSTVRRHPHLFEVEAEHLAYIRYDAVAEYQHVAMWPPAREFTRQHDSATTLAAPQPAAEIIVPA